MGDILVCLDIKTNKMFTVQISPNSLNFKNGKENGKKQSLAFYIF